MVSGIADASRQDVEDIIAINCRSEILRYAAISFSECTTVLARDGATRDGHAILAMNWDWIPALADSVVLLVARPDSGPAYVSLLEAGMAAKNGFNSAGIGVVTNALNSDADATILGLPHHVIMGEILSASTVSQAAARVITRYRPASANYLIADGSGEAVGVEAGPGGMLETSPLLVDRPTYAHTNHFVSLIREDQGRENEDSRQRLCLASAALQNSGQITPMGVAALLRDHSETPHSLCRHLSEERNDSTPPIATIASLIVDLTDRRIWISGGPPCDYDHLEYVVNI